MSPARQLELAFDDLPRWDAPALEAVLARDAGKPLRLVLTDNARCSFSASRPRAAAASMFLHARRWSPARPEHQRGRGGRGAPLHEREHAPRAQDAARDAGPRRGRVYDSPRSSPTSTTASSAAACACRSRGAEASAAPAAGNHRRKLDPVLGLIRIHPVLDRPGVPRFFLESVVHHEMLHHHMGGVPDRAGRTVYHTRAFREAEARFPRYREALAWEKVNLPELLRASHALDRERRAARAAARTAATR
jgi:hypothetical protein